MRRVRAWGPRLLALFRRDRLDRELAAELESHLSMHAEDNLRAGMPPEEAHRQAVLRLGGVAQVEAAYRSQRGIPPIEHVLRDVRLAARSLRRHPGLTVAAIFTLGLGVAATTVMFGFVNAALLRPLPVERPGDLVFLNRSGSFPTHSYPNYLDIRDRNTVLEGLVAYRFSPMSLGGGDTPRRIWGYLASGNYFDVLGVQAARGRTFTAHDDLAEGGHPMLVLSHRFWQSRFGGDPAIVGREVAINERVFTVLGVMPPAFTGTELFFVPDVWVPIAMQAVIEPHNPWLRRRQTHNLLILGRLRSGVTVEQAEKSLNTVAAQLGREHPDLNEGVRIHLSPPGLAGSVLRGPVIGFSSALLALAFLVLLLACTNLTGLLLVRATDRQRERAICVALGAARLHLIRQSLAESALLSIIATAAAVTLTWWLAGVTAAWRPPIDFPLTARIVVDHRVLVLSIALAVLVTVLVGLAPALHGLRRDVVPVLKDQTTGVGPGWHFRDIVVAAQMALSAVLLIGALLVVRSLHQATQVDVGFNPRNAVAVRVDLALQGYDDERGRQLQRRVVERLSTLPGIESAGVANSLPLSLDQSSNGIYVEHRAEPRGSAVPFALYYQVSAGFFRTLETPLIEGRDFNSGDRRGSPPVAIVNQAFAHQLVGSGVIGRRFRTGRSGSWTEIVGVVRTGKYQSLGEAPKPVVFYPIAQSYNPTTTVLARTSMAAPQALDLVRRVVHDIDPALSLYGEGTLTDVLALPLLPLRIAATALAVFGILAVVLVTGGTYALVSYSVARRTREICIRLAVGAAASHIARLVLARTAALWLVGAAAGVLLMFLAGSLLSPVLLGVSPRDPAAFMAAAALLALVTCAACLLPLRRALASDPAALLRDE